MSEEQANGACEFALGREYGMFQINCINAFDCLDNIAQDWLLRLLKTDYLFL